MSLVGRLSCAVRRRFHVARALRHARASSLGRFERGAVRRVLVVCYGNIYRSPFVAEMLRRDLPSDIEIRSAGFHPVVERPSPLAHVEMCAELGVLLAQHRSALVRPADVEWADTIVLMDRRNWIALREMGADDGKCVWLGSLAPGPLEIPDPYNLPADAARRIVERLQAATRRFIERVLTAS